MAGNLTNLHGLILSLNPLRGGFPDWMKNLKNLWMLDLTECGLSGTLPDIFGGSLPFLFHLVRSRPLWSCYLLCFVILSRTHTGAVQQQPYRQSAEQLEWNVAIGAQHYRPEPKPVHRCPGS
jgi:hypothetical protein